MNFALLGDDPAVLPLIEAIGAAEEHRLSHAAEAEAIAPEVLEKAPSARLCSGWDELLTENTIAAVLVAGHTEEVLQGARRLATAGKSLLVFPRAAHEAAFLYELMLIRDDSAIGLFPVFWRRFDPPTCRLRQLLQAGTLGRIFDFQFERHCRKDGSACLPARQAGNEPILTSEDVDEALLQDVDLLRSLAGDYNQVTALRSGTTEAGFTRSVLRLAGENLPEASWTMRLSREEASWCLTVTAEAGEATLHGTNGARALELPDQVTAETGGARSPSSVQPSQAILEQFTRLMQGEPVHPDWTDFTRAREILDAAGDSLRRRRTVDLHFGVPSERSLFKTQMTGLGCGLLVLTLFGVVVLLILGALFQVEDAVMRLARIVVFLPLFLFLLLQLLVFVARPSSQSSREGTN